MKIILSSALYIFFCVLSLNSAAFASDILLNGSVYFNCNFNSTYMGKHGYVLIKKDLYIKDFKTNRYAARDAKVVIKNQNDAVIGTGKTDDKGNYSVAVPGGDVYRVVVRFHDREIEETVSSSKTASNVADLGYFDTETVGNWIPTPDPKYCYTCNIRYLETKKGL